jgi:hypothetical protein
MIGALTSFAQEAMLDHTIGLTPYAMPTVYLGLSASIVGEGGSLAGEPSAGNYGRVALSGKMAATVLATGRCANSGTLCFPRPSADWGAIACWFVADGGTPGAGNVLIYGALDTAIAVKANAFPPNFLPGDFHIDALSTYPSDLTQYLAKKWLDHLLDISAFRDRGFLLDVPAQKSIYGGTGGLDGTSDLAGKRKPFALGWPSNITPATVIPVEGVYQVSDGPVSAISAVRDTGYPRRYLKNGLVDLTYRDARGRMTAGLDRGIEHYVLVLREHGIDTCQSCQGGPGHTYLEPTIEFRGGQAEGPRAIAVALTHGFPIATLRREWRVSGGELIGPIWTMTFRLRADLWLEQEAAHTAAWFKRKKAGRDAC